MLIAVGMLKIIMFIIFRRLSILLNIRKNKFGFIQREALFDVYTNILYINECMSVRISCLTTNICYQKSLNEAEVTRAQQVKLITNRD